MAKLAHRDLADVLRLAREWADAPRDIAGIIENSDFIERVNKELGGEVLDRWGRLRIDQHTFAPPRGEWPDGPAGRLASYRARIFAAACRFIELERRIEVNAAQGRKRK